MRAYPIVLLLVAAVIAGCQSQKSDSHLPDPRAQAVWDYHMASMESVLRGGSSEAGVEDAYRFFSDLTGIRVDLDDTHLGLLANSKTAGDVERLRDWHSRNAHRLGWDEARKLLILREESSR